jgi:hypothetical protein
VLTPPSVDGMIVAASTTLLADSRSGRHGGELLADVAVLRAQPELAGPVASDPVVSRQP